MGILDQVQRAMTANEAHLKILLWGPNGTGKSTCCGTAPKPILYCYTERQGVISFSRTAPDEDIIRVDRMATLREILKELRSGTKYKTIVLDSFTEMQMLIIDELADKIGHDPNEPLDLTYKEHGFVHEKSKGLVRAFRDLPMHVVITALSETVILGDGDDKRAIPKVMLHGKKLPAQIGQFFNLMGFLFKAQDKSDGIVYRVLFEGRQDIESKGMPGLRFREEHDIAYWYERAVLGCEPRDPEARMIGHVQHQPNVESVDTGEKSNEADQQKKAEKETKRRKVS